MMSATTNTTASTPTQTPALKMPPITSQPESVVSKKTNNAGMMNCFFIIEVFLVSLIFMRLLTSN